MLSLGINSCGEKGLGTLHAIINIAGGSHAGFWAVVRLASVGALLTLSGCAGVSKSGLSTEIETGSSVQNWTPTDIDFWSSAPAGSRLMPYSWFMAIERAGATSRFSDLENLTSFGYLRPENMGEVNSVPVGFAVDRQRDVKFTRTKLKWYASQPHASSKAEPWIGFNCAACHTKDIRSGGQSKRIYGGDSDADLQALIDALGASARETLVNSAKWSRFAKRVLTGRNTLENRTLLRTAMERWIADIELFSLPHTNLLRYGVGRTDAFGQIFNAMQRTINPENSAHELPDAAVNYPVIWNSHRQKHLQWNGYATNTKLNGRADNPVDLPALGRNMGSIIGSFGEIGFTGHNRGKLGMGVTTSVHLRNMIKLEEMSRRLTSPQWPTFFPTIEKGKAERGGKLFDEHCSSCHLRYNEIGKGNPSDTLVSFKQMAPRHLTDIWAACNIFARESATGRLAGKREFLFSGSRYSESAPMHSIVTTMVWAATIPYLSELLPSLPGLLSKSRSKRRLTLNTPRPAYVPRKKAARAQMCRGANHPLLAYKARPLDGIWSSAPYLHNGSVPTLYDLLLPAKKRPTTFWLGDREFDPVKVGVSRKQRSEAMTTGFLFRVRDRQGRPIEGNSNAGHEYGVDDFGHEDRLALVEYLKGL